MSQIPSTGSTGGSPATDGQTKANDFRDVDVDQFLTLLIAQLQNQDPLSPMDNSEMLQQIGQIREISATNKLSDTLDSVLVGQNLSTASGLIGKEVKALTDDAQDISGLVDRISITTTDGQRSLRVHIGDTSIDLKNIREVMNQ